MFYSCIRARWLRFEEITYRTTIILSIFYTLTHDAALGNAPMANVLILLIMYPKHLGSRSIKYTENHNDDAWELPTLSRVSFSILDGLLIPAQSMIMD